MAKVTVFTSEEAKAAGLITDRPIIEQFEDAAKKVGVSFNRPMSCDRCGAVALRMLHDAHWNLFCSVECLHGV